MKDAGHTCSTCGRLTLNPINHFTEKEAPLCRDCYDAAYPPDQERLSVQRDAEAVTAMARAFRSLEAVLRAVPELREEVQRLQVAMIRLNKQMEKRRQLRMGT